MSDLPIFRTRRGAPRRGGQKANQVLVLIPGFAAPHPGSEAAGHLPFTPRARAAPPRRKETRLGRGVHRHAHLRCPPPSPARHRGVIRCVHRGIRMIRRGAQLLRMEDPRPHPSLILMRRTLRGPSADPRGGGARGGARRARGGGIFIDFSGWNWLELARTSCSSQFELVRTASNQFEQLVRASASH